MLPIREALDGADCSPAYSGTVTEPQYSSRVTEILDALEGIILEEGFRRLRLTEVASRLSTSYATLYKIAPSKDALVGLVVERWYARKYDETMQLLAGVDDPVKRLVVWLEEGTDIGATPSPAFYDDAPSHPQVEQLVKDADRYFNVRYERLLNEAMDVGAIRQIDAAVLTAATEGITNRFKDPRVVAPLGGRRVAGQVLMDVLFNGILPPESDRSVD